MNIYEKLSAITEEITAVAKNLSVGFGQNQYKAVGEADVLAAVKPIERKYGVYSYPMARDLIDSGILENVDYKGNVKKQMYLRLKTTYKFVNVEDTNDSIIMEVYSDGVDPQDKAPGKAMTYGDKYALLKAYKIITGEDPDQYMSAELKTAPQKASQTSQEAQEEAAAQEKAQNLGKQKIGAERAKSLTSELIKAGADPIKVCTWLGVKRIADITEGQQVSIIKQMDKVVAQCPYEPKKED